MYVHTVSTVYAAHTPPSKTSEVQRQVVGRVGSHTVYAHRALGGAHDDAACMRGPAVEQSYAQRRPIHAQSRTEAASRMCATLGQHLMRACVCCAQAGRQADKSDRRTDRRRRSVLRSAFCAARCAGCAMSVHRLRAQRPDKRMPRPAYILSHAAIIVRRRWGSCPCTPLFAAPCLCRARPSSAPSDRPTLRSKTTEAPHRAPEPDQVNAGADFLPDRCWSACARLRLCMTLEQHPVHRTHPTFTRSSIRRSHLASTGKARHITARRACFTLDQLASLYVG